MDENGMRTKRALAALRAADQQGMGRVAGGMGAEETDRLADLDACTLAYRKWSPALIPGLLQTDSYAASAIRSRTPSLDIGEIEIRVAHRRRRAASFLGRRAGVEGTYAWFLIGEAAITRPVMSLPSHGEQLRQLLAMGQDYGNLVIQVLPETISQPGAIEPFEVFHLDPGPVVGHLESLIGGWYTVASEDIARLHGMFSDLVGAAMDPADSRTYIQEVLDTCWGLSTGQTSSSPRTATLPTASTSPALPPAPSV
jgi:hypothetical protein